MIVVQTRAKSDPLVAAPFKPIVLNRSYESIREGVK